MSEEFDKAIREADQIITNLKKQEHAFFLGFIGGTALGILITVVITAILGMW